MALNSKTVMVLRFSRQQCGGFYCCLCPGCTSRPDCSSVTVTHLVFSLSLLLTTPTRVWEIDTNVESLQRQFSHVLRLIFAHLADSELGMVHLVQP